MALRNLRIILTAIFMLIGYAVSAQSYAESALLFSSTQPGGSARIQGAGGAQIALGGDYSSALSNPAGLGMFNRSEFTLTPALSSYSVETKFLGSTNNNSATKFNIPGISLVFNFPDEKANGFLGGSLGISMSRINDFNSSYSYSGVNSNNSIVDFFLEQANGGTIDQFKEGAPHYNTSTGLAYYTFLIGPLSFQDPALSETEYFTDAPIESRQSENVLVEKAGYQWSASYGVNFNDMFFLGGGLGLTTLRYQSKKTFTEEYLDTENIFSTVLTENLDMRGSGINATLGAIVRPVSFLQLGISFVSPTVYQISENYDAHMDAHWNDFDYETTDGVTNLNDRSAETDIVTTDYTLTTPLKLSGGIAFISKYGFISADIEMTNPAQARYKSDIGIPDKPETEDIKNSFQKVYNYRIGGEFRYKIYRFRGGYSAMGNPYANSSFAFSNTSVSGGAGVRLENFYIDLAVISKKTTNNYSPYTLSDNSQPVATLKNKTLTTMITFGFTF